MLIEVHVSDLVSDILNILKNMRGPCMFTLIQFIELITVLYQHDFDSHFSNFHINLCR